MSEQNISLSFLSSHTVKCLQNFLRKKGLKTSGIKNSLTLRIEHYSNITQLMQKFYHIFQHALNNLLVFLLQKDIVRL